MKDIKQIKKIIIAVLLFIGVMITGAIVLAHDYIKPSKPGENGRWKVEFTSIVEGEKTGLAASRYHPWHTATNASFHVDFTAPGDSIVYDMQVSNFGNMDAVLSDIDVIHNAHKDSIKYELIGLKEGDKLKRGEAKNFRIKISYMLHAEQSDTFSSPISLVLTYVQDH